LCGGFGLSEHLFISIQEAAGDDSAFLELDLFSTVLFGGHWRLIGVPDPEEIILLLPLTVK
jgi:hypothetical protein